ncbi:DUF6261 family protein [Capnocytophaga catalasegens]|uniref:Hemagglutinin n=1 Tax=Capnocytophaga catalasegens TaxID=1004260 RepID=A0AAV5AWG7_9FLAO|nr:DUF6261 family protein [Capnocytophaga catalasegens]GIZ16167.1 hypothetical protein RCZ03_21670 [Capnocytophaga catalasegens]GJM50889.1 hypothetical protein RCZ15_18620 [Capnocytophaga catalasegens]GJM53733.1 hypothetical protein RCZ16_20490 [Capnocytophaga catalasegens]
MIQVFDLKEIRLMEFFQVMQNVKSFLEQHDMSNLGLTEAKITFDQKLLALEQTIKPLQKSPHTQSIQDLDAKRDALLVGFLAHCRAFTTFPEQEKSKAAQKLLATIEKYGKNIHNKPLQEETAIIYNLLKDFEETSHQQAITAIGAEKWIQDLTKVNQEFAQLHNTRTQEQGEIVVGATKQARKELNEAFKHVVKSINALAYINGKDKYQSLANSLNEEIKRAKAH